MLAFDSLLFRSLATISLLIAIVAALFFARAVFLPIALGLLIALILHLPITALLRAGLPKILAVILLISIVATAMLLIFLLMAQPIREVADTWPQIVSELRVKLQHLRQSMAAAEQAGDVISQVAKDVQGMDKDPGVQEVVVREPNFLARAATSLADIMTGVVITLTISGFILVTRHPFLAFATMPFANFASKLHAARIWRSVEAEVSHYFFVTSIINAVLGLAVGLALWALDVPSPHVWGVAVALLNYVLFVGPAIGTAALLAASIITFDSAFQIVAPPAAYLTINFLEANLVTPHFLGRRLNVAPLAILLSLLFWGWLWGFAGLIMAIPALVILKAVSDKSAPFTAIRRILTPRRAPSVNATLEPSATARVASPERSQS